MHTRDIYYLARPLLPRGVQLALRRGLARRERVHCKDNWPINENSAKVPGGWPGWPDGKRFALVLTHDVETALGQSRCERLMNTEEAFGLRSSFNFVPERYPDDPALRRRLEEHGFEVGIHGLKHDGKLYRSRATFNERAERINAYLKEWKVVGFRSPSMHHNLDWLHDLDAEYDASTFDYDPFQPQSDGVGTLFPFWIPAADGKGGYAELPYTLDQDFILFVMLGEQDINIWKHKLDWVVEHGGMVLLNTHPDYMAMDGTPSPEEYPASFYREFLEYVTERYEGSYWHALPREVGAYVREHKPRLPGVAGRTGTARERVCFVRHGHFPDDPILCREVDAQLEAGREVDIICLHFGEQAKRETYNGANVYRIPVTHHRSTVERYFFEYGVSFFLMSWVLLRQFLRRRYDVIQVNAMPDFLVFCTLIPKLCGARIVQHLYEPTPELFVTKFGADRHGWLRWLQEWLEQRAISYADWCFAVSGAIRARYGERGADTSKITVLRNVSTEAFDQLSPSPSGRDGKAFRLITHGLVERRCGQEVVLKAVKQLADEIPELRYDITGGGEYEPEIREQAKELGIADRVHIWGYVSREKLHELLTNADVGVITMYPSPYAKLVDNIRMYEFVALRKPAIVSRFPSIEEVFDDTCMTFANPGDSDDVARCIRELHDSPELGRRRAANAYERYQSLKWSISKEVYLKTVSSLLPKGNN